MGFNGFKGFDGVVDEVKIFNRVLSAGDVDDLFTDSAPGVTGSVAFQSGSSSTPDESSSNHSVVVELSVSGGPSLTSALTVDVTDELTGSASFDALAESGYDGWLTIEAFGSALPSLAAATKIWRRMFDDEETLAREGHDFIRREWEKRSS